MTPTQPHKMKHPAFIGYSEIAQSEGRTLYLKPKLIHSMKEYELHFGGPPPVQMAVQLDQADMPASYTLKKNFFLYDSVNLYFDNGGAACFIVSVGIYTQSVSAGNETQGLLSGLWALNETDEINLIAIPDAVSIHNTTNENDSFQAVHQAINLFCSRKEDLTGILDLQEDPCNPSHQRSCVPGQPIKQIEDTLTHSATYSPWVKIEFASPLKLKDIKLEKDGKAISFNTIDPSKETAHFIEELEEAIDNSKRLTKSITRRQRGETSLTHRYQTLLTNYLATPSGDEENLPLHFLLLFLKGMAEMINNWICACNLNEALAGDIVDIIRQTVIPEIATLGLPDLIAFHHQAIKTGMVEAPVTGYNEMFCLTSCVGSNCPWQKGENAAATTQISMHPQENQQRLAQIFDHFDEAILVTKELTEQFENTAHENLLAHSPFLQKIVSELQQSRYIPPSGIFAAS